MINLLPNSEKKNVEHEYRMRRAALVLMSALFVVLIASVLLLPSYMLSIYKGKTGATVPAPAVSTDQMSEKEFKQKIDNAKVLIRVLKPGAEAVLPTKVIELLEKNKMNGIRLTSLTYTADLTNIVTVNVQGIAATRQGLSLYTDALSKEDGITKVDVPISNFTKDTNILFTFTVTLNSKQ